MKVLFLDVDGVLNCKRTPPDRRGFLGIDPYMTLLVDRIVQATGCKIVLSSTWRLFEESREQVKHYVEFIDCTPQIDGMRGVEIQQWLHGHPEVERYAILDDDIDMLVHQLPNFFITSWENGLTEEIAKRVINHLNNASDSSQTS